MLEEINIAVNKIDKQLKGFQSASVDYVLEQMYTKHRKKVLIADEVGLGKTIIAKGVIAKAIKSHKPSDRPFHVVYICSNQVLAQQNISKLNPIGRADKPLSRLVYLAYKDNTSQDAILKLSSLTPSTSFKLTNSVGTKKERAMLYTF
jgi:superfamily II DNA or RNA helicase